MTYERLIRFTWDTDSVSEREFAIDNMTGLAREMNKIALHMQDKDDWKLDYHDPLKFPVELNDSEEWLDFAIEHLTMLGHKVEWDDSDRVGVCVVRLRGENFPLLLGYNSEAWLNSNLKKV